MRPDARPFEDIDPECIERREDEIIGRAGSRDLTGHMFVPPATVVRRPAVVLIHGGGWWKNKPRGMNGFGELLSRMGYVCLSTGYRLSGEAHWPAQIEDVKCAIRYLKANQESLGLDPDRIGVVGNSAGGHLALMTALRTEYEGAGGHAAHSSTVKAVCGLYAPVRLERHGEKLSDATTRLMGPGVNDDAYEKASPLCYDLSHYPPCLLIHGAEDEAVPLSESVNFYTALSNLGRPVDLHIFSGEAHAFDRRKPGQDQMVSVDDPGSVYGLTVVRLIAHFFSKYL